jgi:hypothetical protein
VDFLVRVTGACVGGFTHSHLGQRWQSFDLLE